MLDRGHVIRDGDGVALRMVGGMTDLTESRELHATIAREREFLAALLDSLNEGVIACDAQGHLSHYTPVVAELHSTSELPARPGDWSAAYGLCDATTGERLAADEVPLARALAGETVRDFEMLIHPSTGPERLVQVNGQAVYSREGTQLGAVVTMRDITDQRRLELDDLTKFFRSNTTLHFKQTLIRSFCYMQPVCDLLNGNSALAFHYQPYRLFYQIIFVGN